jgi:hypothetical protein
MCDRVVLYIGSPAAATSGGSMRNRLSVILFIALSACLLAAKPRVDVTGAWTGEVRGQEGGTGKVRFVLRQEGDRISGTAGPIEKQNPGHVYDAKLDGNHLTLSADDTDDKTGLTLTYRFELTVANDQMQGKAYGRSGDRTWTLDISMTREK